MPRYKITGIFLIFNISCTISFTGGDIKGSIQILPVENQSNYYGVEGILGSVIYNSFRDDGRFRINEKGEYTLKIIVKDFKKEPFYYEGKGEIKGYKFTIISNFIFQRNADTLKLIEKSLREEIISDTGEEIDGLKKISLKLKEDIIKSILELW